MAGIAGAWGRARALDRQRHGARPLGRCVGNALEVRRGRRRCCAARGPDDVRELAAVRGRRPGRGRRGGARGRGARAGGARRCADGRRPGDAPSAGSRPRSGDPAVWTEPGALPTRAGPDRRRGARATGRVAPIAARARSARSPAGWGPGACTPTSRSTRWWASSCARCVRRRASATGDPIAVIHARDEWAGERARDMAAACIVRRRGGRGRGPVILARGAAMPELPEVETIRAPAGRADPGAHVHGASRCTTPSS